MSLRFVENLAERRSNSALCAWELHEYYILYRKFARVELQWSDH